MSPSISTKFTKLFNLTSPIVSAPMGGATTPALVAAVTNAGGMGFLAAANDSSSKLATAIDEARAATDQDKQHLIGTGFVGWILETFDTPSDPRLETVLDKKPTVVWFAFGQDLGKQVARVRDHDTAYGRKTFVFVNVNTVDEALRAANVWNVDVLVVQGAEAGGRGSTESPPTEELLKAVLDAIPGGPLVIAAGGISTGAQIASMLAIGASAVVLGTRFLLTHECGFSEKMKEVIIEAGPDSTTRSPAYDVAFPPGVWPKGIEARSITNSILTDFNNGVSPADLKASIGSDKDHLLVYAGAGVADVKDIQSTKDLMYSLYSDTITALKSSGPHLLT